MCQCRTLIIDTYSIGKLVETLDLSVLPLYDFQGITLCLFALLPPQVSKQKSCKFRILKISLASHQYFFYKIYDDTVDKATTLGEFVMTLTLQKVKWRKRGEISTADFNNVHSLKLSPFMSSNKLRSRLIITTVYISQDYLYSVCVCVCVRERQGPRERESICLMSPGMLRGTGGGKWKSNTTGKESKVQWGWDEGRKGGKERQMKFDSE